MLRTFLRQSLVVLAAVALYLPIALYYGDSVQALTISLPNNCTLSVDGSGNGNVTCSGGGGGSFSCSMSASVPQPAATQPETLTATCSNAGGTVSYSNWTVTGAGGSCPGPSSGPGANQATVQAPGSAVGPCQYSVVATDSAAPGAPATPSVSLTYTTAGGGGPIACTSPVGTSGVVPTSTRVVTMLWGGASQVTSGWHPGDALVVKFHTPVATVASGQTGTGSLAAIEYVDAGNGRYGALSNQPCDFTTGLPMRNSKGVAAGCGYSVTKNISGPSVGISMLDKGSCVVVLQPDTDYFWNLINFDPATGINNCTGATCNMIVNMYKPLGT